MKATSIFCCLTSFISLISIVQSDSNVAYYLQLYNFINGNRTKHVAPSLKWNRSLNEGTEYIAQQMLQYPDSFDPSELEYHGINYFKIAGSEKPAPGLVIATWYNESKFYDFNTPGYNSRSLNFTQLIWKSSSSIGFGVASSRNYTIVLADFDPAGNTRGKFKINCMPSGKVGLGAFVDIYQSVQFQHGTRSKL